MGNRCQPRVRRAIRTCGDRRPAARSTALPERDAGGGREAGICDHSLRTSARSGRLRSNSILRPNPFGKTCRNRCRTGRWSATCWLQSMPTSARHKERCSGRKERFVLRRRSTRFRLDAPARRSMGIGCRSQDAASRCGPPSRSPDPRRASPIVAAAGQSDRRTYFFGGALTSRAFPPLKGLVRLLSRQFA